jgi:dTDP-4-dehydrorhamnose 3,5-epimerase
VEALGRQRVIIGDTGFSGLYLIELERIEDERGMFARSFCMAELGAAGIDFPIVQANISFNNFSGTVRGMHFQRDPHAEGKIVRCTRGALFDVVIDLRPGSETFCQWFGTELNADNRSALLIPPGFAHGFQTLSDATEVHYLMSAAYSPESASGVRYDDPAFAVEWPIAVSSISEKDRQWPDFTGTRS